MAMEPSGGKAKSAPASGKKIPEHVGRGKLPAASKAGRQKTSNKKLAGKPSAAVMAPIPGGDRWELEDGLRTLHRAEEVRTNKKLMRGIVKHAEERAEVARRANAMMRTGAISKRHADRLKEDER